MINSPLAAPVIDVTNELFTGTDFLVSLDDGREVWFEGERINNVTNHPAFRNSARSIARLYDALHDPKLKDDLTLVEKFGITTHRFFVPSYSAHALGRLSLSRMLKHGQKLGGKRMNQLLKVGIIGDFDPNNQTHIATNDALIHAARTLAATVDSTWLPTPSLDDEFSQTTLKQFDALWCAPASPYKSMNGALRSIQFAREQDWPFIGT